MIVKILSSARNFEGIDYSERKNDQGISQLLVAKNFGALAHQQGEVKKADYINYMKLVSDANTRVTKRQFHAVISAREKSHSPEELTKIAEQYLKSMGYGKNPYLIYFHRDTNNNHVHMVSTRVDKNGKKVDDSYEKIRSQKVLQQILEQDPALETKMVLEEALKYQFSTKAQFKLLLEEQGFKIAENEGQIDLIKYGVVQGHYSEIELAHKLSTYNPSEDRIRQLKALIIKYKNGLDLEAFKNKMHQKFGVKLVIHQDKKHQQPYGYTIIDHPQKQVIKGSQIIPIKHLLLPVTQEGQKQLLEDYLAKEKLAKKTYYGLIKDLKKMGFHLDGAGITAINYKEELIRLDSPELKKLKYNSRLAAASKYATVLDKEKKLLARLYHVNPQDLLGNMNTNVKADHYYRELLLQGTQARSFQEILNDKQLEVLRYHKNYFLLDRNNHQLLNIQRLLGDHNLELSQVVTKNFDASRSIDNEQHVKSSNALGQLTQLFDLTIAEPERQTDRKRSKRKQQKF